jgi:ankyrin repeat protein
MRFNFKKVIYLFIVICFSSVHAGSYEDFFRAVNIDNDRTVRSLLASGFDPNTRDERGQVGLFLAMREGSPKVATALLAHPDIKVDAANAVGETPLMMAALRGNLEWSQRLIERGGQLSRDGWTPLHYAASGPEPKVVALLLDRGAPIDALSPNRTTPLMMAARYGDEASADLLLARGADAKLRNEPGLSAADFARLAGRDALAERLERRAR